MDPDTAPCPCGSGRPFPQCCAPLLAGTAAPPTAEALMRSRYTAYVRGDLDYIERTHAPEAKGDFNRPQAEDIARRVRWLGLDVRETIAGGVDDTTGTVEFTARFRKDGFDHVHRERAHFRRDGDRWLYLDGEFNPRGAPRRVEKVGRNQPCPCGSGRKFKQCCGKGGG